jgi:hypothetical protein
MQSHQQEATMKLNALAAALAATAFIAVGPIAASAQTTIIEQRPPVVVQRPSVVVAPAPRAVVVEQPPVVVEQPSQSVTVQRNDLGLLGNSTRTTVDTVGGGVDCRRQTVQTNTLLGSTTATNKTCD